MPDDRTVVIGAEPGPEGVMPPDECRHRAGERIDVERGLEIEASRHRRENRNCASVLRRYSSCWCDGGMELTGAWRPWAFASGDIVQLVNRPGRGFHSSMSPKLTMRLPRFVKVVAQRIFPPALIADLLSVNTLREGDAGLPLPGCATVT